VEILKSGGAVRSARRWREGDVETYAWVAELLDCRFALLTLASPSFRYLSIVDEPCGRLIPLLWRFR
jgi:hypothetical protein